MSMADAKKLYEGMFAIASEFNLSIAGGDTTRWPHPLAIDVAILARPYPGFAPVTRSGARVGDRLHVTGPLGGSILEKHLDFIPRVKEAELLARTLGSRLHAMIDISDGLSLDLWRVCQASHVGATLDDSHLQTVISDAAKQLAAGDGKPPLDHALSDGEDFELLFAVDGRVTDAPIPIFPIGSITESLLQLRRLDGTVTSLQPQGYIH
jgi:thiamine-monophosphate kinase